MDTNVLIWWHLSPRKLSHKVRRILEDPYNTVYFSPLNMWEISIKYQLGRLPLGGKNPEEFFDAIDLDDNFLCLNLLPGTLVTSFNLPLRHSDMFDNMLVWESLQHDLVLLTADETLRIYEQDGLRLVI
ncbi:MAG: type II toxin-antitoxin system VapC family toxin [Coriobacteriia bacterium]|nr:type II toxin-antitoxin system VapC family toxin [Coriobacteriia bacterium]